MAVSTRFDEEPGLAIQQIRGDLSVEGNVKVQQGLDVGLGCESAKPCPWDATHGDGAAAVTGSARQQAASRAEPLWKEMADDRTAILVAGDSDFGMGQIYEQMAASMPRELGVFRDRDEALAWLLDRAGE